MQIPENILVLIEKYQTGKASTEELHILNEWYHSFNDAEVKLVTDSTDIEHQISEAIRLRLAETMEQNTGIIPATRSRKWPLTAAAAALLLIIVSAVFYFTYNPRIADKPVAKVPAVKKALVNDIDPGGNKAVLQLADGSKIILDSASQGLLTSQGNITVEKLKDGLLLYKVSDNADSDGAAMVYNTISTPRGGQYMVTLSDGTNVWLNAASSIYFPVTFKGNERRVEITGEAYFEVAKNTTMPFKVKAANSEIEVLGTHFNVNAYTDEASVKTTLIEGKVKVSSAGNAGKQFLSPGQQSAVGVTGNIALVNNPDIEEVLAWKNGKFQYNAADIKQIMRQMTRWYDAEIEYHGAVNLHFTGELPRYERLSVLLEKLALTNEVHFKIDGKKVIVSR